jgi:hypothetical protein
MAVAAMLMAGAPGHESFACGYDNPQSVSRGFLNWIYPDSLYVIGAISREVAARRLPLANFDQAEPDLFGRRFGLTKMALEQFGEMLRAASPERSSTSIALVLVEPMLWTRFEPSGDGLRARVHVSGAERGDLVLVSGEAVLGEIANGRMTIGEASDLGLLLFYGPEEQMAKFIGIYRQVGSEPLADSSRHRAHRKSSNQPQAAMTYASLSSAPGARSRYLSLTSEVVGEFACGRARH